MTQVQLKSLIRELDLDIHIKTITKSKNLCPKDDYLKCML